MNGHSIIENGYCFLMSKFGTQTFTASYPGGGVQASGVALMKIFHKQNGE